MDVYAKIFKHYHLREMKGCYSIDTSFSIFIFQHNDILLKACLMFGSYSLPTLSQFSELCETISEKPFNL